MGQQKTDMKLETKLKHTPAPWKWGKPLDALNPSSPWPMLQSDDPDAGWIAMTADPDGPDARLIAAAPDMLAALMGMITRLDNSPYSSTLEKMARAAITKAIGENQE